MLPMLDDDPFAAFIMFIIMFIAVVVKRSAGLQLRAAGSEGDVQRGWNRKRMVEPAVAGKDAGLDTLELPKFRPVGCCWSLMPLTSECTVKSQCQLHSRSFY